MRDRLLRVLHVLGGMRMGGAETLVMQIYRNIDRKIVQFDFAVAADSPCHFDEEIGDLGGRIFSHPIPQKGIVAFNRVFNGTLTTSGPFDAVHSHIHLFSGNTLRLARRTGVPVRIAHGHTTNDGAGSSPARALYRWIARRMIAEHATHLVSNSVASGEYLFGRPLLKRVPLRVLPNAFDLAPFATGRCRGDVRRELNVSPVALLVAHVGRFDVPKNHKFVVEVFAEVRKLRPDAVMILVGEGPLKSEVAAYARQCGVDSAIHFLGVRSDVPDLLATADVFLFPSLYEGLGNVVVEAQAAGLPCVVSSAIPPEADLQLGLVQSMSLEEPTPLWARTVVCKSQTLMVGWRERRAALVSKGYEITSLAKTLTELYANRTNRSWLTDPKAIRFHGADVG